MSAQRAKVVLVEPIHEVGVELLREAFEVRVLEGPADPRFRAECETADAVIVRSTRFGAEEFAACPILRVVGRHGAGTDNIDLDIAAERGVSVVNTPRSNTESVAEYVIAVIFWSLKRLDEGAAALAVGAMPAERGSLPAQVVRRGLVGGEIQGRALGLLGFGAIGRAVARRARALGMRVLAFDPYVPDGDFAALEVERAGFDEVLSDSDVVSLHVPGRPDGTPLISHDQLGLMREGALLVNAARGMLVDADALVSAVRRRRIVAAVDVFDPEPPPVDSPLLSTPGILATPHQAAMTEEALERMARDVALGVIEKLSRAD